MMLHSWTAGDGDDLFLVHGWGMNGVVWQRLVDDLSRRYRVTIVDLPGHGHSPFDGSLNAADWADALLDAAPESAVWIGWSLGGALALESALKAPDRVRGLFLVTSTPRFIRTDDWKHGMPRGTLGLFRDALVKEPAATLERFLALQVKGSNDARGTLRALRDGLAEKPAADTDALDAGLELLRSIDLRHRLPELAMPSRWLFGDRDMLVPGGLADSLADYLPDARTERIEGAAHAPFLSHREQALNVLHDFLDDLP